MHLHLRVVVVRVASNVPNAFTMVSLNDMSRMGYCNSLADAVMMLLAKGVYLRATQNQKLVTAKRSRLFKRCYAIYAESLPKSS